MKLLDVLKYVCVAAWVALVPIHPALISVMSLPLVDLVFALLIAKKQNKPITSAGLKRTIAKIMMYEAATIFAYVTETSLLDGLVPAVKMVTGLIGMTELKSCLEHLDELGGNALFGSLLKKLAPDQPVVATTVVEETSETVITKGPNDAA
jgi:hypothetical protein